MAKKRRRRPRAPIRPPSSEPAPLAGDGSPPAGDAADTEGTAGSAPPRTRRDRPPLSGGRLAERMRAPSPYPTLSSTIGRSVIAAGSSVLLLAAPLVFVGAVWLALVAAGMEVFPITLVGAMASPPISTFFVDVFIPSNVFGPNVTLLGLGTTLALTLVRAGVMSVLVGAALESLEYGAVSLVGVLQGLRAFPPVLVIMLVNLLAILAGGLVLPVILGPIGQVALIAVLFGSLYLLPMAPAAAVRGQLRAPEALRGSARAARLPGSRHLVLALLYFFVSLMLVFLEPGRSLITANPPLVQWVWVLGGTFVQVVFLAAFCLRWLTVGDQVPTAPAPRRPRRSLLGGSPR
jgi:hypothetical protein